MSGLHTPTPGELNALKYWKSNYYDGAWKELTKSDRLNYIKRLISDLNAEAHGTPYRWVNGQEYSYLLAHDNNAGVISVDIGHPSIISSLHELGHHLFGSDEFEACRFAVGLFKAAFPKAFEKLHWKGHLLVKAENA